MFSRGLLVDEGLFGDEGLLVDEGLPVDKGLFVDEEDAFQMVGLVLEDDCGKA